MRGQKAPPTLCRRWPFSHRLALHGPYHGQGATSWASRSAHPGQDRLIHKPGREKFSVLLHTPSPIKEICVSSIQLYSGGAVIEEGHAGDPQKSNFNMLTSGQREGCPRLCQEVPERSCFSISPCTNTTRDRQLQVFISQMQHRPWTSWTLGSWWDRFINRDAVLDRVLSSPPPRSSALATWISEYRQRGTAPETWPVRLSENRGPRAGSPPGHGTGRGGPGSCHAGLSSQPQEEAAHGIPTSKHFIHSAHSRCRFNCRY